jgi:medium-chain acyl-[acyl-carrier-protein] hydrolase
MLRQGEAALMAIDLDRRPQHFAAPGVAAAGARLPLLARPRSPSHSPWLVRPPVEAPHALRLFVFPFAGGGPAAFRRWQAQSCGQLAVHIVHLPGRESRIREPPLEDGVATVEALLAVLAEDLREPYVLFGHSMGSYLAFELTRRLESAGLPGPRKLIVSGGRAPHVRDRETPDAQLDDDALKRRLRALRGTPDEVLENPELLELVLPLVRADMRLLDSLTARALVRPVRCPIIAYGGADDAGVPEPQLAAWAQQTLAGFRRRMFAGGHFFLFEEGARFLDLLVRDALD